MKTYQVEYKLKCCYTDQPIGELQSDLISAKNEDHLLFLYNDLGYHVCSFKQIA